MFFFLVDSERLNFSDFCRHGDFCMGDDPNGIVQPKPSGNRNNVFNSIERKGIHCLIDFSARQ